MVGSGVYIHTAKTYNLNTRLSFCCSYDTYGGLSRSPGDGSLLSPRGTHIPATRGWWLPAESTRQQPQLSPHSRSQPQAGRSFSRLLSAQPRVPRDQHVILCACGGGGYWTSRRLTGVWRRQGGLKSQEMPLASSNQQFSVKTKGRSVPVCSPTGPS